MFVVIIDNVVSLWKLLLIIIIRVGERKKFLYYCVFEYGID